MIPADGRVSVRSRLPAETSAALLLAVAFVLSQWSDFLVARWLLRLLPVWAGLLLLTMPKLRRGRLRLPLPLTAFLVWCLASFLWTFDRGNSLRHLVDLVALVSVGWVAGQVLGVAAARRTLARTVMYVVVASVLTMVLAPAWSTAPGADGAPGWHGPFPHKNGLGFFCAFAVLTLWTALPRGWSRRLWVGLGLGLLIGSRSASALGALGAAAALMAWHAARSQGSARRRLAVDTCAGAALGLLGAAAMLWPDVVFRILGRDSSLTGRRAIWTAVEHWIGERPVLGYGFGGVWDPSSPLTMAIWRESRFDAFYAHNGYLDIPLQVGVIGLVLLIAVLVGILVAAIRPVRSVGSWPLGVLVLLLLTATTESAPFSGNGLLLVALLAGVLTAPADTRGEIRHLPDGVAREWSPAPPPASLAAGP